jgi:NADH:ubiquinone oxidoreductase subunit 6 (subunit J)
VPGEVVREVRGLRRFGALLAVVLAAQLWWALTRVGWVAPQGGTSDGVADLESVAEIGRRLYTEHAFAFEVTSVLILTAMLGAVVLARRADVRETHRDVTTEEGETPGAAHEAPRPTPDA